MSTHFSQYLQYFLSILLCLNFLVGFSQIEDLTQKLKEAKTQKDNIRTAEYLNKIGFYYWEQNQHEKAIDFFNKSISTNLELGNNNALRVLHSNVGNIYIDLKKYKESLTAFEQAEIYSQKINDRTIQASALLNTANALKYRKKYKKAIVKIEKALQYSQEAKNNTLIRSCYGSLAENYKEIGNEEKSYEYFNLYASFNQQMHEEELTSNMKKHQNIIHSLESEQSATNQELQETENALEKNRTLLEAEEELNRTNQELISHLNREKALKEEMLKKKQEAIQKEKALNKAQQFTTYLTIGLALILGLFTVNILLTARKRKKTNDQLQLQKDKIEEKSNDLSIALNDSKEKTLKIEGSINYAERIQRAMLPSEKHLQEALPESFIFFEPRDGVSGDFYWFADFNQKDLGNERLSPDSLKEFFISAVDCTGHGVPGAFMAMLGFNMMTNILREGHNSTDDLLTHLHTHVRSALKQETTSNRDGMDMAICGIYQEKRIVEFSGAKNPVVYIQDGELFQIKGDKHPIGGIQKEEQRIFTKHSISLRDDTPTYFYLFSDGFPDQFGGEKGRKFMIKKLKILLLEIHKKPMKEQKEILSNTFKTWMGDSHKQIDDVLVIGFKVD